MWARKYMHTIHGSPGCVSNPSDAVSICVAISVCCRGSAGAPLQPVDSALCETTASFSLESSVLLETDVASELLGLVVEVADFDDRVVCHVVDFCTPRLDEDRLFLEPVVDGGPFDLGSAGAGLLRPCTTTCVILGISSSVNGHDPLLHPCCLFDVLPCRFPGPEQGVCFLLLIVECYVEGLLSCR